MEPRRADYAIWWLRECGAVPPRAVHAPRRITYDDLARVHTPELLESLGRPEAIAHIFAVDASDVPVDEVMTTIRLACGATLAAARETLRTKDPALNLLGGFHHAAPGAAGGFCPVNDVAVAVAAVRGEGFSGRVAVLDLDAHPPDGIAACLARDPSAGSARSPARTGARSRTWTRRSCRRAPATRSTSALAALLGGCRARSSRSSSRAATCSPAIASGSSASRSRAHARRPPRRDGARGGPPCGCPAAATPDHSWRVLAGTGMALAAGSASPSRPTTTRSARGSRCCPASCRRVDLTESGELTADDLEEALGMRPRRQRLLLGFYTASGMEHALYRYGIFEQLERIGYRQFRVTFDSCGLGERVRVYGEAEAQEHLLVELVLERRRVLGVEVLYVHWLSLRNPRAQFSDRRPRLPGQEVPGLGLAREAGTMLARMAVRLGLGGVVFRPGALPHRLRGPPRVRVRRPRAAGRFEALVRDLANVPLLEATIAVAEGRVRMDGEPYTWEADEMAYWLRESPADAGEVERERERVRFTLVDALAAAAPEATLPGAAVTPRAAGGPRPRASALRRVVPEVDGADDPGRSTTRVVGRRLIETARESLAAAIPQDRERHRGVHEERLDQGAVLVEGDAVHREAPGHRARASRSRTGSCSRQGSHQARPEVDDPHLPGGVVHPDLAAGEVLRRSSARWPTSGDGRAAGAREARTGARGGRGRRGPNEGRRGASAPDDNRGPVPSRRIHPAYGTVRTLLHATENVVPGTEVSGSQMISDKIGSLACAIVRATPRPPAGHASSLAATHPPRGELLMRNMTPVIALGWRSSPARRPGRTRST